MTNRRNGEPRATLRVEHHLSANEQLAAELAEVPGVALVALAGAQYQTVLRPCQWPFAIPMKGLGIGQQLGYLTNELARLEPAA
jgi:hypothetical protein